MVLFMTVDYNEGNIEDLDYKGIVLQQGGKEVFRAKSEDFTQDYVQVVKHYFDQYEKQGYMITGSSSIGHYIKDARIKDFPF